MKNESTTDYQEEIMIDFLPSIYENKGFLVDEFIQPELLFITSYPPRECGIATYSHDLIKALNKTFDTSMTIKICALESENEQHLYPNEIEHFLNTDYSKSFFKLAKSINKDPKIAMVLIQHEFGLFEQKEEDFNQFLDTLVKPLVIVFHTVLPGPNQAMESNVKYISERAESIVVMTQTSADILINDYGIDVEKISIIPHGTHLVRHESKELLKEKHQLIGKMVLSTFGLLSPGKSIETTLDALPSIIKKNKNVLFLIIGKTHPSIVKRDGERYRAMLEAKVVELDLQKNVKFINQFLPLHDLLDYLQLTDVYLFTSKNPNQAVSGTFSYAISCGCPIVSTPIPHAREILQHNTGISIDFEDSEQLAEAVNSLLSDEQLRKEIGSNGLHKMASTAWENSAIAHAKLFQKIGVNEMELHYNIPPINLDHIKKMTTDFGMIQFSKINQPDINSGYTIDDNARAMIAMCQYLQLTKDQKVIPYIQIYFNFIKFCLQPKGYFLNYVDENKNFTEQNDAINLADANGRAIWALGFLISKEDLLPNELVAEATITMQSALANVTKIHSTRAMAFIIKGLYYRNSRSEQDKALITQLADRLVQMYKHETENEWHWFESYLTYANSILPEAMLCAWIATENPIYKNVAKSSFDFLLSKTFNENNLKVISNKTWMYKGEKSEQIVIGGEQPIDVAYTIIALHKFADVFQDEEYKDKMESAFNWFLGSNHLSQIIYNPCTGGCYDGLEENYVNLNQGAESTVSYLMARIIIEETFKNRNQQHIHKKIKTQNVYAQTY